MVFLSLWAEDKLGEKVRIKMVKTSRYETSNIQIHCFSNWSKRLSWHVHWAELPSSDNFLKAIPPYFMYLDVQVIVKWFSELSPEPGGHGLRIKDLELR